MQISFTKMHGLGNDFIVFESSSALPTPAQWRQLADRRTGIGFDQALVLEKPRQPGTDVYYRIFNADGSEVEQCGNGARCVAKLVAERQGQSLLHMDSPGGRINAQLNPDGMVSLDMGIPNFNPAALPFEAGLAKGGKNGALASAPYTYSIDVAGQTIEAGAVSMGNPHVVLTVPDAVTAPVATLGPALESHPRFPRRVNVGFMEVLAPDHIRLRVFERGVGETQACGTGACAAVACGRAQGLLNEIVRVDLPGGTLHIRWPGEGEHLWMTGPAVAVYTGTVPL